MSANINGLVAARSGAMAALGSMKCSRPATRTSGSYTAIPRQLPKAYVVSISVGSEDMAEIGDPDDAALPISGSFDAGRRSGVCRNVVRVGDRHKDKSVRERRLRVR